MKTISSAFENNSDIPAKYTCSGEGINPPLEFTDIPEGTVSLALIVDDPDAPGGDFVHWLLWNVLPHVNKIEEDSVPANAIEGVTSIGIPGYVPPCPPVGVHRYQFKLHALDCTLTLEANATKNDLLNSMQGHVLSEAMLVGKYQKR